MVLMENELNDNVMAIKALESQFSVTYKQYQEAEQNYKSALKYWMSGKKNYIKLDSMTSAGGYVRDTKPANNVDQCVGLCSADECMFAAFSQSNKSCSIMDGNLLFQEGTSDQTGIVPDVLFWATVLQNYNETLIELSQKILTEFDKMQPRHQAQVDEKNQKKQELKNKWNALVAQREKLNALVEEHNSLKENNENQALNTNYQNATFKAWFFLAMILILLFLKQLTDIDLSTKSIIIIISAITFIALSFNLSTMGGFFVWLVVLLLVVMLYPMFKSETE